MMSSCCLSLERQSALCGIYMPVAYKDVVKYFMDEINKSTSNTNYPLCINGLIVIHVFYNKIFPVIVSRIISLTTTEEQRQKILSDTTYILAEQKKWNKTIIKSIGTFYLVQIILFLLII